MFARQNYVLLRNRGVLFLDNLQRNKEGASRETPQINQICRLPWNFLPVTVCRRCTTGWRAGTTGGACGTAARSGSRGNSGYRLTHPARYLYQRVADYSHHRGNLRAGRPARHRRHPPEFHRRHGPAGRRHVLGLRYGRGARLPVRGAARSGGTTHAGAGERQAVGTFGRTGRRQLRRPERHPDVVNRPLRNSQGRRIVHLWRGRRRGRRQRHHRAAVRRAAGQLRGVLSAEKRQ